MHPYLDELSIFNFQFQRLIRINYPTQKPSIKTEDSKELIFCVIRKKWLAITPEEWVRQNFLLYLIHSLNYPASLISVEKQLQIGEMKKRFDIIVYKNSVPYIIVECKEMNVPLKEQTLMQVLRYNSNVQAPFIVVTNGSYCSAFMRDGGQFLETDAIPNAVES